jgi:predicted RNA methylase
MAARVGAKHVFCTELDPNVAAFARQNIKNAGLGDKVTLIEKSTLELRPEDLKGMCPDVIMAENLSTWQVTEPENEVMTHLRRLFGKSPLSIPGKAFNFIELCESQYSFMDVIQLRTHYFEFTGIPGPKLRSKPALFTCFDYSGDTPSQIEGEVLIQASSTGVVNSLRLTSPLEVSPGNVFSSSDSLMPPVVVPLPNDVHLKQGESLIVGIKYTTNTVWESFHCEIRRPS